MAFQNSGQSRPSYLYSPQYQMGLANMQAGMDTSPVASPWQGLARVLQAGIGGYQQQKAQSTAEAQDAETRQRIAEIIRGSNDTLAGGSQDDILAQIATVPGYEDFATQMQLEQMFQEPANDPLVEVWDGEKMIRVPSSQAIGLQSQAPETPDPFMPDLQTIDRGGMQETGYFGPDGNWVRMSEAPRWAPQAAPQPSDLDTKIQQAAALYGVGTPEYETAVANIIGAAPSGGDSSPFKDENVLRDDFNSQAKPINDASVAIQKINAAAENPSAVSDTALIFAFMKVLDPSSTVREGEQATIEEARGAANLVPLYNRVITGERLTDQQRAEILQQANAMVPIYQTMGDNLINQYTATSEQYGLNPANVITPFNWGSSAPVQQPTAGPPKTQGLDDDALVNKYLNLGQP